MESIIILGGIFSFYAFFVATLGNQKGLPFFCCFIEGFFFPGHFLRKLAKSDRNFVSKEKFLKNKMDPESELKKYGELLKDGVISDSEYRIIKDKLEVLFTRESIDI